MAKFGLLGIFGSHEQMKTILLCMQLRDLQGYILCVLFHHHLLIYLTSGSSILTSLLRGMIIRTLYLHL